MSGQQYFKIDVFSHHFVLSQVQSRGQEVAENFAKQYIQFGLVKEGRRFIRAPVKVFAARVRGTQGSVLEYRFHIEQLAPFMQHLANMQILPHTYDVVRHDCHPGAEESLSVLEKWQSRDYQIPIIEYLVSPEPAKAKLVEVQTGKGKSYMAMAALAQLKRRFLIIVKPMYIDKWKGDLKETLGLEGHDVVIIQGSTALMALIAKAKQGELTCKAIIISNKTLQNWYSLYERKGRYIEKEGYDCYPSELCQTLDVGVRLIDEVHQDFHLNFKIDLYTHVDRSISLSATLKSDDNFLNRMYEVAYPKPKRYAGLEYDRYVHASSFFYHVKDPDKIKTTEWGSTTYSHHAFEKSIMRDKHLLKDYLDMIVWTAMRFHFERYPRGEHSARLLIYCASIQMCTYVVEHLRAEIKGLDVRRYVEEDPYEDLMEADVSVSTLLSAGTGVDIPGLTTVILTTAISSSQSNIQGFGRLRKLPNKKLQFVYFACLDIPKHVEYHEKKRDMLKHMALDYDSINYHHSLGT